MGKFNLKEYDDRYYKWHYDNTRDYIIKTMDWYIQVYKPNSVIDYGCGIGAYLESAMNNGIEKIKGFDIGGDYVKNYTNINVMQFIEYLDCTKPLKTNKYDCVISLETGEHIETELSETFVKNITDSTSDEGIILYSAAQPNQNGTGHINCQTKDFWIRIFEKNDFLQEKELTKHISDNWFTLGAPNYICDNLIVFKKKL